MSGTSMSRQSLRLPEWSHPFEQLRQRDFLERLEHEVRVLERERRGDRIRDGNAEKPCRLGCAHAVQRVLEGDRLVRPEAEHVECLEIERRPRLCTLRVAVC